MLQRRSNRLIILYSALLYRVQGEDKREQREAAGESKEREIEREEDSSLRKFEIINYKLSDPKSSARRIPGALISCFPCLQCLFDSYNFTLGLTTPRHLAPLYIKIRALKTRATRNPAPFQLLARIARATA